MGLTKIELFGGSGFVGSHLSSFFKNEEVSLNEVSIRNSDWKNDIRRDSLIWINLIGKAHDHKGTSNWETYVHSNVNVTKEIFNEFLDSKAVLFIHLSSISAIEEIESIIPLMEEGICSPNSYYGRSKRLIEEWLIQQRLNDGKKVVILRPPMIHGPGDKGNLSRLYRVISKGVPYPFSSFDNNRTFLSIWNFVFIINEIVKSFDKLESGIYHLGDDESVSTKDLIEIINQENNRKGINIRIPRKIILAVARLGDKLNLPINSIKVKKMTSSLLVSNDKIKSALNLDKLPLSAKEGIRRTVKSFNTNK
ncbi:NAD-dependent epimerase/dehydratase family protein [Sphingobacterium mizutaii]|uniref:NAD-dependent epimerase/dehydratase family protein n=1 Tax=Sphingobacterium mizutaii TaxID=1010 RepID=UPI0028B23F87|nr:NAD-dependent epimerase/dehydratase family protein [Sphingobacterium mizutaii]